MEQLVIFLLFIVASIVSSIIQKKKQAEEEARERNGGVPPNPAKPVSSWPRSAQDWQEQLRKMLEQHAPPPIVRPALPPETRPIAPPRKAIPTYVVKTPEKSEGDAVFVSPLRDSASAHQRASSLHSKVEERFRAIDQRTDQPLADSPTRGGKPGFSRHALRRLRRNPEALREAFVASLIFSPPKSLETPSTIH